MKERKPSMKHSEQLSQIADILDNIFSINAEYVSFTFTLHTYETGVTYNIYTPTVNHNKYNTFNSFKEFLLTLVSNGENSVRRKVLHKNLEIELKRKKETEAAIKEIHQELANLKEDTND